MITAFDGGSFKCGVTAFGAWSLVTVFLAGCASLPQMCLGWSTPCTGVILSPWELFTHLLWFRLCCPWTAFAVLPGCGVDGRAGTQQTYYTVSQSARFTRWSKMSYLFRVFSPHGWIEKCVRVSMALCHTVSSGRWRNCCRSRLQPSTCWLPLYPGISLSGAGQ